ncbi:AP-5 complex subunit sigma-1 [Cynoglossus semilaevis]|uniref:Adaptor related protein complex 5 subunit sigma 1 n=1 Tax=Cynoglossus semilaevis TaxID=244447 RepID=A0A3P8WFQ7_CYNSE|nr:AP-5 complex subunit sigma-1 [Cynoglossus semilaevis]
MVRCFLIHTVVPVQTLSSGDSRVLYSRSFGPNELDSELSPEDRRLLEKERMLLVVRQVRSTVSLSREASGKPVVEMVPGEETLALQESSSGVIRLRAGEPFPEEMSAIWLAVQSLGFTLVCEAHENLLLAEGTLRNLVRHCLESLHMLGQGSEVLLRSHRIDALLNRLLPHGQLLFLNHRFHHSLEKEVAAYVTK